MFTPILWKKNIQLYGIPRIDNVENMKVGKHVSINGNTYIQCTGGVTLGDYVTISYGCVILTTGIKTENYSTECKTQYRMHENAPVIIGEGVWLGACTKIMPGCTIAKHKIVGAGSVVTKNLDKEGWLYAGVPALPIKPLS